MTVRFGLFEIDLATGELRRDGDRVPLAEQPRRLLAALVSARGAVVRRDELQRLLWPDGVHVDYDRGLSFCVQRLRAALGDTAGTPIYVETVPRQGYRFVAPLAFAPLPAARRRRPSRRPHVAVALVCLLALGQAPAPPVTPPPVLDTAAVFAQRRHVADAERWLRDVEAWTVTPHDGMPRARAAAERALAASDDARARLVLAKIALRYEWDAAAAERHLRAALRLDPRSAPAHLERAELLLVQGRLDEAVAAAREAEEIDPVCPVVRGQTALVYYFARRLDDAAASYERAARAAPDFVGPHERLVHVYRHAGEARKAGEEAVRVVEMLEVPADGLRAAPDRVRAFLSGTVAYLTRDPRRAAAQSDRLAVLHAALGHPEEAERWLLRAAEERPMTLPLLLARDPDLQRLADRPVVAGLRRRLLAS